VITQEKHIKISELCLKNDHFKRKAELSDFEAEEFENKNEKNF
jgi:hypothetical protein